MLLLHNRGRRTGINNVNPLAHLPDADDPAVVYVFASAAGRPEHPQWYRNLIAAGDGEVEIGAERFHVEVVEITGAERDRIYALQVERMPGFGEYERRVQGGRTIPVLALRGTSLTGRLQQCGGRALNARRQRPTHMACRALEPSICAQAAALAVSADGSF